MVTTDLDDMADAVETPLDGIAVIGMAGRFPGARNLDEFWQNLCSGKESISMFSDEELVAAGVDAALLKHPKYVKAGTVLPDADCFDAEFFGYLPKEAGLMDPQHRLFLECAWEALENAGYPPSECPGSVGVFGGCGLNSYWLNNLGQNPETRPFLADFPTMLANDKDFLTVRVAYKLNLKGPSVTVQTACSTSLVAVVQACQSLLNFQCDVALAGGVAVHAPLRSGYLYQEGMILSPDGHCRAFDAKAQGTVSGAGVGLVVLKRLSEALEAGDSILAVIRGAAMNNDGSGKVGFTAPSVEGQAQCIATAQAMAEVTPDTISYVETHGTGTPMGDPIELLALSQAFRAKTDKKQFCAIGSLKPSIGHADAAAGIAGLIKLVLMLRHKKIPASLHFETPNPKIDFEGSPFFVNTSLVDWKEGKTPRRAGVSSFGIGGTNAHCVLEEAPKPPTGSASRPVQLLVWSARSEWIADDLNQRLAAQFSRNPELSLADAAFTLQQGRTTFETRRALVCRSGAEVVSALASGDARRWISGTAAQETKPSVVFLFPGQGAQFVRMGEELYRTEPVFRREVDTCSEYLLPLLGVDLRKILYPEPSREPEARERIHQTEIAQPALFTISYALAQLWIAWGVTPSALIGHSIGEYVAAVLAGVFPLHEALRILAVRARLTQSLPSGSMLAVKLPSHELEPMLAGTSLSIAATNSPSLTVVSGPAPDIQVFSQKLQDRRVATKPLATSHAFHSSMMDPAVERLTQEVAKTSRSEPRIPMMSTLTGKWFGAEDAKDPSYWARQLRHGVRFVEAMGELLKVNPAFLLEIGPGQTLTPFVKQHPGKTAKQVALGTLHPTTEPNKDWEAILASLGRLWVSGVPIAWERFSSGETRLRVPMPSYPFARTRHWVDPMPVTSSEPLPIAPVAPAMDPSQRPPPSEVNSLALAEKMMSDQLEVMKEQLRRLRNPS